MQKTNTRTMFFSEIWRKETLIASSAFVLTNIDITIKIDSRSQNKGNIQTVLDN